MARVAGRALNRSSRGPNAQGVADGSPECRRRRRTPPWVRVDHRQHEPYRFHKTRRTAPTPGYRVRCSTIGASGTHSTRLLVGDAHPTRFGASATHPTRLDPHIGKRVPAHRRGVARERVQTSAYDAAASPFTAVGPKAAQP